MRLYHIDAFTNRAFQGNPAAVCLMDFEETSEKMQAIASEMNLSETAFVWKTNEGFGLRWFTPSVEVRLCGHATLAAAFALLDAGECKPEHPIRFSTQSGVLTCQMTEHEGSPAMALDFPSDPVTPIGDSEKFTKSLGIKSTPVFSGYSEVSKFALIEIKSSEEVATLVPDYAEMSKSHVLGVIVTAKADSGSGYDFASRFFAPNLGIPEDPVTGAAHCCLTPYWANKLGKTSLKARQVSRRGGDLGLRIDGSRVTLIGRAVILYQTRLQLG